ncbi:MAG: hypothetical protein RQ741_09185 [Wenzhouxiangellaceae bacterium]|nr:hypothetical protein [Wenzhouxiangellaceae bacterium]
MLQKNNILDIRELLRDQPERCSEMCLETSRWRIDLARTPMPIEHWRRGFAPAALQQVHSAVQALFDGSIVNPSENQPASHVALRADRPAETLAPDDAAGVETARAMLLDAAQRLFEGRTPVRTLLHVGIGGSDLGPRLVAGALDEHRSAIRVEWLPTLDEKRIARLMADLDPASTGMVVASKSFTTSETLKQAGVIRQWMGPDFAQRCWAATARPEQALVFGIQPEHVLAFPASVGGRFSLWSGVGLSAAALIGADAWRQLLDGARQADRLLAEDPARSPALALAKTLDFLVRDCRLATLGVVSYDPALRLLADYLQQLVMESLGKSVTIDGESVDGPTTPLIFGGAGTDLQHSLFQAVHQGTQRHPMLLLGTLDGGDGLSDWRREQLAHLFGQASALVQGKTDTDPQRSLPGNNPVLLMLARTLNAETVGELLSVFEQAVYLLGTFWNINPFDQWGVEEGKRLAGRFRQALAGQAECPDPTLEVSLDWVTRYSQR